ncbi:hypothetical protein [Prochlorococcus marinus]|nr:hypothetical protein [Prochlorococcus marinus]
MKTLAISKADPLPGLYWESVREKYLRVRHQHLSADEASSIARLDRHK